MNEQMNNNIELQPTNNNSNENIMNVPNSLPTEPSIKSNATIIENNNGENKILNNTLVSPVQISQNNSSSQDNIITNNIGNNTTQINTSVNHDNSNQDILNLGQKNNKFLINNTSPNETSLSNLNINGEYNNMDRTDYMQEPRVRENLSNTKKNTVTITPELKIVIIIALVLLVFIFVMPYIFDLLREVRY